MYPVSWQEPFREAMRGPGKGGQMNLGRRRFLVAGTHASLVPLAGACRSQPPLTRVGEHSLDPVLEGLVAPHFLPVL